MRGGASWALLNRLQFARGRPAQRTECIGKEQNFLGRQPAPLAVRRAHDIFGVARAMADIGKADGRSDAGNAVEGTVDIADRGGRPRRIVRYCAIAAPASAILPPRLETNRCFTRARRSA
jgi:hypothetical protein